ncbi:MAG: cytochrome c oxidase subunit II [Actinomycetales bacterium]|nr:cytochrome c oxidase subunit II [Actinomycetales bacterium]
MRCAPRPEVIATPADNGPSVRGRVAPHTSSHSVFGRCPLRKHADTSARVSRRGLTLTGLAVSATLLLSGCANVNSSAGSGWLPEGSAGQHVTSETGRITTLWVGTWIAGLAVGLLVWGLTIWCMVAYRRKKDDPELPPQLRYNIPIELLYTVVPVLMVAVLFFYTARDEAVLMDVSAKPDYTINVVGKQWSWDFNYVDADVYQTGVHSELNPNGGTTGTPQPVLYLPVDKRVQFVLNARDVIHSFWVPAFLVKLDMIPGKTNRLQVTPTQIGEFQGKCAELCGAYHSQMLFKVKVVSQADFDAEMAKLKGLGQTGQLPNTLNRETMNPDDLKMVPTPTGSN